MEKEYREIEFSLGQSIETAVKELEEEAGISVHPSEMTLVGTIIDQFTMCESTIINNEFDDIYTYVDESIKDIDKLLYELRKSCKEQIMVFGFYNPFTAFSSTLANTIEPVILYANNKMEDLVKKYDMTYVDIHDMFLANDNYLPKKLEIHPTTLGYKAMAKSVISLIDKKTLAK